MLSIHIFRVKTLKEFLDSGWVFDLYKYALELPNTIYYPKVSPSMLEMVITEKDQITIRQFMQSDDLSKLSLGGRDWTKDMFEKEYSYISQYDSCIPSQFACKCCIHQLMRGDGHDSTCSDKT